MSLLAILWFAFAALFLAVYAVLDGFDLGVGMFYGLAPRSLRPALLTTISPVWNGNEVFLLAGVGSILAAFPLVYGSLLSGMYLPVMLTLVGLVFRATGIELRGKFKDGFTGGMLDFMVAAGSLIPAWAIGAVAGNVIAGFPIDQSGYPVPDFLGYLNPFAICGGVVTVLVFALHGLAWLRLKGAVEVKAFAESRFTLVWMLAALGAAGIQAWAIALRPEGAAPALPGMILAVAGFAGLFVGFRTGRALAAFLSSCLAVLGMAAAAALSLFPVILPSKLDPAFSLTVANAAAGDSSLTAMLLIGLIGLPLVAVYVVVLYRVFRNRPA